MKKSYLYTTLCRRLSAFFSWFAFWKPRKRRPKISVLIPYTATKSPIRKRAFKWLLDYWKHELPGAEIIVGRSSSSIFCKNEALNNAARRATGRVLVIADADTYIDGQIINRCADKILEELHNHLWFVPYRNLYRLSKRITKAILKSDPENPLRIPSPPPDGYVDNNGHKSTYGHRYGAMIMMFPREALDVLGCFDERFKGWGGEDIALLRALDTLYGRHKTTDNDVLHLWHPYLGKSYKTRVWKGQESGQANDKLSSRYNRATGKPTEMRNLVNEGCNQLIN